MSELKTRFIDDTYVEYYNTGKHDLAQIYLKSEADKVIAHNKYKRCLTMAKRCAAERDIYNLTPRFAKMKFYTKWRKRWLELAEKFKEAK